MIGDVSYPLESKQGSSGQGFSLLTVAFDVFEFSLLDFKIKVHFSSTAAENTPKKTRHQKKNSWALCVCCWSRPPQQFLKVSSFWFIKAIFQLDWDAYLSPLRGACWVCSAADLLEV